MSSHALATALHPPTGKATAVFSLTSRIPSVLFIYKELVELFDKDNKVKEKLEALIPIIKRDEKIAEYLKQYRSKLRLAVAFTHWWFRKEWGPKHPGLLRESPQSVFRRYLHNKGQNKQFAQGVEKANQLSYLQELLDIWIREYLSS